MKLEKETRIEARDAFRKSLELFIAGLTPHVATEEGDWSIKGFIDIYKNIYTISSDTKIVSKILEIHLFPKILQFAESIDYSIVLAEQQNWYPDLSFVSNRDSRIKFAVDLKTTYRDPYFPGHVNGFTLGSHGAYFRDRESTKNIQYPYSSYSGHFCLGIIYSRTDQHDIDETEIMSVKELGSDYEHAKNVFERRVTTVDNLKSIASVIRDFQFFVCEKWQLASDGQGSGNTANIGSITCIDDIIKGNGVFSRLGEDWFDEYWINYKIATMVKDGRSVPITNLRDFLAFKSGDISLINKKVSKRKAPKQ
jgi:hypothetical protein